MKSALMQDLLPTDARQASKTLLASLESLELINEVAEQKAKVVEDATTLAMRIGSDYPENPLVRQGMMQILTGLGAGELDVSTESLSDALTKLSGFWRKRKPSAGNIPDEEKSSWSERDRAVKDFVQEMDKTYLNSNWLTKQKFVEGDIAAKDFSGVFQINGNPVTDPLANIEQHKKNVRAFFGKWFPIVKKLNDDVRAIHKRTVAATAGASLDDEKALDVVRQAVKEFEAFPDPLDKLPAFTGTALANKIPVVKTTQTGDWIQLEAKMSVTPTDTLPALNKDDMLKVAMIVKEMVKDHDYWPEMERLRWLDFKDGSKFVDWIYDADNSLYMDYYHRFYWQGANDCWIDGLYWIHNKYSVVTGLIKWMDRSIK